MDNKKRAPATVEEAVAESAQLYDGPDGLLVFGRDIARGVDGLAPDAGPPTKILTYLGGLASLAEALRRGPLGSTLVQWLKEQGYSASGESDSIKQKPCEIKKRTWDDGTRRRTFELHMKPNDATRSDRCVRIYFDWDDEARAIIVAWIGRHP